jgi:molybdenum cofactor cytidylyltransferase
MSGPSLHVVILAAGGSSRFGSPKQLIRYEGHSLLQRSLHVASEVAGPAVTVVLGAHAADIIATLPTSGLTLIVNRDWAEGIASSIRSGISRLPGACDGALLLLADQPLVQPEGLSRLAAQWRREPRTIVASRYGNAALSGVTGVPAVFPRWCFPDLLALRGDQGARALFHRYAEHVRRIELPEAAVDIDRPEDLLELQGPAGDSGP